MRCDHLGAASSRLEIKITKLAVMSICVIPLVACGGGGNDSADQTSFTIAASANVGGTISPIGNVIAPNGTAKTFTVTPDTGYRISSVSSTCNGALNGNSYTTQAITANCSVEATFAPVAASAPIAACFTASKPVEFALVNYQNNAMPLATGNFRRRSVGPSIFNGQPAIKSTTTAYGIDGMGEDAPHTSTSNYWTVTDAGISMLGRIQDRGPGYTASSPVIIPLNMQPGQSINLTSAAALIVAGIDAPATYTFIGLEKLTLAGKSFFNVCHFRWQNTSPDATPAWQDTWYAPGYGEIQLQSPAPAAAATGPDAALGERYDGDI